MNSDEEDSGYFSEDGDSGFVIEEDDKELERIKSRRFENDYAILKESDIRERLEDDIEKVSNVLSVSRDASCNLLRHFNWSVSKVNEEWFSDEERVRKVVGLLNEPVFVDSSRKAKKITCGVCLDPFSLKIMKSAACGHPFCKACWEGYITTSINDGPGCLLLRCPQPSCTAFVGQDMISSLVSHEYQEKYFHYLLRSYVEDNKKTKWCPAPSCEYAVMFTGGTQNYDVCCRCAYHFCWNCVEEAHRPVDCETVAKWTLKNNAESENTNWILSNSKPCPKCKRPIEKSHGCMHMTCSAPCKFSFCWLCLRAWEDHGTRTGDFLSCNRYAAAIKMGAHDDEESRRQKAKNMVERYAHYFERWASNHSSRKKAISDLQEMQTVKIEQISETHSQPVIQLKFIVEAWEQIVECRRVLKWTYAYGYYLPEDESTKKQFFEYLQGEAESGLERLHQCVERDLEKFLKQCPSSVKFSEFRSKLAGLTRVTKDYFENLVRALENGLADVKMAKTPPTSISTTGEQRRVIMDADWGNWSCIFCNFSNKNPLTACQMCRQPR